MTTEQFVEWVSDHCKYTGGNADTADLLVANRGIICSKWGATYAEMCECSQRLIESGRSPKFPNEQMNALHAQLVSLRSERLTAVRNERRSIEIVSGCDCPACNGGVMTEKYANAMTRFKLMLKDLADGMAPPRRRKP